MGHKGEGEKEGFLAITLSGGEKPCYMIVRADRDRRGCRQQQRLIAVGKIIDIAAAREIKVVSSSPGIGTAIIPQIVSDSLT